MRDTFENGDVDCEEVELLYEIIKFGEYEENVWLVGFDDCKRRRLSR